MSTCCAPKSPNCLGNLPVRPDLRLLILLLALALLAGCATTPVQPWERGRLAKWDMRWDPDPHAGRGGRPRALQQGRHQRRDRRGGRRLRLQLMSTSRRPSPSLSLLLAASAALVGQKAQADETGTSPTVGYRFNMYDEDAFSGAPVIGSDKRYHVDTQQLDFSGARRRAQHAHCRCHARSDERLVAVVFDSRTGQQTDPGVERRHHPRSSQRDQRIARARCRRQCDDDRQRFVFDRKRLSRDRDRPRTHHSAQRWR